MTTYKKIFAGVLEEKPIVGPDEITPDLEQQAFSQSHEPSTDPEAFNTEPLEAPGFEGAYIGKAKGWVTKLEKFANWINSMEGDSLNRQLNEVDREGSPFEGIAARHSDKLVKASEDLVSLAKAIEGYVLSADRRQRSNAQSKSNQ